MPLVDVAAAFGAAPRETLEGQQHELRRRARRSRTPGGRMSAQLRDHHNETERAMRGASQRDASGPQA